MNVVIDTNILRKAVVDNSWEHIKVMSNLDTFSHYLTLDYENLLFREYQDEVGQCSLFQKWYSEMAKKHHIYYCSHNITKRHAQELLRIGFHEPEDHIVVGLALNADKYVVTEDSDFGKGDENRAAAHHQVLCYFNEQMGLTVHCANEANIRLPPL